MHSFLKRSSFNPVCFCLHVGADVHLGCGQDRPLHAAARAGESTVVELLLDFGADRSYRNADGKTPLDLSAPNSTVQVALQKTGVFYDLLKSLSLACFSDLFIFG